MKAEYLVEADHPTFRRIDKYVYSLHSLVILLKGLDDNGYENVNIITLKGVK